MFTFIYSCVNNDLVYVSFVIYNLYSVDMPIDNILVFYGSKIGSILIISGKKTCLEFSCCFKILNIKILLKNSSYHKENTFCGILINISGRNLHNRNNSKGFLMCQHYTFFFDRLTWKMLRVH